MGTCLVYNIDEGLGVIPREICNHLGLIMVCENCRDQRNALVRCEGTVDQLFPGRTFAAYEKVALTIP